jgi:gliding motility-associated-like protein
LEKKVKFTIEKQNRVKMRIQKLVHSRCSRVVCKLGVLLFFLMCMRGNAFSQTCNLLCNADFENPQNGGWHLTYNSLFPCWYTTASDSAIEVWWTGFNGVPAYHGNQFIELNAYQVATMYQNFVSAPGTQLTIGFAHRGRAGVDTMSVSIGPVGGPYTTLGIYGDNNVAWGYYTVSYTIPAGAGNYYSLRFNSIYATGGNQSIGNFLDDVSVSTPGTISIAMASSGHNCFGTSTASATATPSGGLAPYTYFWSPSGGSGPTAIGLSQGTYTVTVNDAHGCPSSSTVNIVTGSKIGQSFTKTPNSCSGPPSGTATVNATGGNGPYTYSWNPSGQSTATATHLTVGVYTCVVTDSWGCNSSDTVSVSGARSILPLTSSTGITCNGLTNGSATVTYTGGNGPLTFSWSPGGQTTATISNLAAGTYTVTLKDSLGCTTKDSAKVVSPTVLGLTNSSQANTTCGLTNGSAQVTATGGTPGYTYSWNPSGQTGSFASALAAGSYTIVVKDSHNCQATSTVTITGSSPAAQASFKGMDTTGCEPLCVQFLNTTPGTLNSLTWNYGDGTTGTMNQTSHCYTSPGTYSVSISTSDMNNCSSSSTHAGMVHVFPKPHVAFTASPGFAVTPNQQIHFTDQSTGPTSWSWNFGGAFSSNQNPVHTYTDSGSYWVTLVITNSYGCKDSVKELVIVRKENAFLIPNTFSPDGDGKNDLFEIKADAYPQFQIDIYDRWGVLVFSSNDITKSWDGKVMHTGREAVMGTYYYVLSLGSPSSQTKNYNGFLTLFRR